MGSFIGHVDEATFFILIAIWWMSRTFPRYIRSQYGGEKYKNQLSYGLPCNQRIPIEAIFKVLFPIGGFIGELANGPGPHFLDEDGHFQKLSGMQHMTLYGMFILHGILDILCYYKVKAIPPGSDYLSVMLCFMWYGLAFSFHAHMPGKAPLETMIHVLPTYIMYLTAAIILLHFVKRHYFILDIGRIWCLLVLGTWFFHTSFVMYIPWGSKLNPAYDQKDHRNVHFIVASFGAHCCLHIVTIPVIYFFTYIFISKKSQHLSINGAYYKANEECEILLESS